MINLNPAAATAAPSALGGVPEAAAGGDFLAMLAGIVGNVTSVACHDGDGVLLPGSPLLGGDVEVAGEAIADLAAELGTILDTGVDADAAADGDGVVFPWPTVQALAAMFAQPATAATDASAADAPAATGEAAAAPAPADATAAAVDATMQTVEDLADQLTPPDEAATGSPVSTALGAAAVADGAAEAVVETTGRTAAPARPATAPGDASTADADAATVLDAVEDADAGEPIRVDASRRGPDAEFRPARSGAADTLADAAQATGELRDVGGPVRDRGPMTSAAAGIARVLDAIEQLEKAPPPRQVTLELGDLRVRVAVEDGAVRMQLLGEQRDAGREFLRSAAEELRERGFEMAGDGKGDARGQDADRQRPDLAPPRAERGFGRSGRPTDPTTAGVRAGIHL